MFCTPLAECCLEAKQVSKGLAATERGLSVAERTGERLFEAELFRLRGELLLEKTPANTSAAERAFAAAIETARRQGAKSFELRATTSLARLLASDGRRKEAHEMLAAIYSWFTEGLDTPDLIGAKALLDELASDIET
jgi:predicted ATPase